MLKKYTALARVAWALTLEYRAQIVLWMLGSFLMIIMLAVWLSVTRNGTVNGFASGDFVAYYMVGWVVRNVTAVWSAWELDYSIRQGTLSSKLLRPINPIHNEIAANWVEKSVRIVFIIPIAIIVLLMSPDATLIITPVSIVTFVIALFGAWILVFLSDYLVGMLAFWTSQTAAFIEGLYGLRLLLSGIIAPLAMFPKVVQHGLRWTPFPYMLNFPTEILTGRTTTPDQLLVGFAVQFMWVAILSIMAGVVWRRAIRSYSAVGA